MQNVINKYESLSIIAIDFDIWSGQTRLSASDIKIGVGGEIPDAKFAQLGTKKVCDPASLKGFHRLKTEARRLMLRYGMNFMNGYAIPVQKTDEVIPRLEAISREFEDMKKEFLATYHASIEEWIKENPEYEQAIRAGALERSAVEKRLNFEYQIFQIQPIAGDEHQARLNRKVEGLGAELIQEVAESAQKFFEERLAGQTCVGIGTKATLSNLRDKIDGLSFLNGKLEPLVRLLDEALACYSCPNGRVVDGQAFSQIVAAVLILSDPKKIDQYAAGAEKSALAPVEGLAAAPAAASPTPVQQPFQVVTPVPAPTPAPQGLDLADIEAFFASMPAGQRESSAAPVEAAATAAAVAPAAPDQEFPLQDLISRATPDQANPEKPAANPAAETDTSKQSENWFF